MSNQTSNRIAVDVTDAMVSTAKDFFAKISDTLPFLVGLTTEERRTIPKIDVANNVFVEDALLAAANNPDILPAYLRVADMKQDKTGYDKFDELVLISAQIAEKLRDTQMLMGSEAYVSALTVYRLIGSAAHDGIPGMDSVYQQLAQRFKGQGGSGTPPAADGNTPTP